MGKKQNRGYNTVLEKLNSRCFRKITYSHTSFVDLSIAIVGPSALPLKALYDHGFLPELCLPKLSCDGFTFLASFTQLLPGDGFTILAFSPHLFSCNGCTFLGGVLQPFSLDSSSFLAFRASLIWSQMLAPPMSKMKLISECQALKENGSEVNIYEAAVNT